MPKVTPPVSGGAGVLICLTGRLVSYWLKKSEYEKKKRKKKKSGYTLASPGPPGNAGLCRSYGPNLRRAGVMD